jgi:hypothetical protein
MITRRPYARAHKAAFSALQAGARQDFLDIVENLPSFLHFGGALFVFIMVK